VTHRSVDLPRNEVAARSARGALDEIAAELSGRQLEDARLLVSELASNAVRHGSGEIKLDLHVEEGDLCVAVEDQGRKQPRMRKPNGSDGGYGLRMVDALADEWGSEEGSSHVWFILRGEH
jgi:anti-sigma regulatory factor (Ser/Thr protein kinase)